jgi:peptidoglycan/xylan/chitin deacetylase (PgdA/CDA1 family)/SAM-dependent methyltransferase
MLVAVIIPAHNAATTISETLDSLIAQTYPRWEAIVVDDGSTDDTAQVVKIYSERCANIYLYQQPQRGVSAARNTGIAQSHGEWLLFLDADDLITERHLQTLTEAVSADPALDIACSGWAKTGADGKITSIIPAEEMNLSFEGFVRDCPVPINACLLRRALIDIVGGFDANLRICEDWDFWLRVKRAGAKFGTVPTVSALYRTRPGSATSDIRLFLKSGFQLLDLSHGPDPRVPNPAPEFANGWPSQDLPKHKYYYLCYCAGLQMASQSDPSDLLDEMKDIVCLELDPATVADNIFIAVYQALGTGPEGWAEIWPSREKELAAFLSGLERHSRCADLARSSGAKLETMIAGKAVDRYPLSIGRVQACGLNIAKPIDDIEVGAQCERLLCQVDLDGGPLGFLELPVFDGFVSCQVLADAIAARFSWEILELYFQTSLYPTLQTENSEAGISVWRGPALLASGMIEADRPWQEQIHSQAGWLLFLQEVWGKPTWSLDNFYDPEMTDVGAPRITVDGDWLQIEVSQPIPDVRASGSSLDILITVGGIATGTLTLPVEAGLVRARNLRAEITRLSGFELCRATVREGLLGRPFTEAQPLQLRLREAAACHAEKGRTTSHVDGEGFIAVETSALYSSALLAGGRSSLLARRLDQPIDSAVSRRASLPRSVIQELERAGRLQAEPILHLNEDAAGPERVFYAPDLIWRPSSPASIPVQDKRVTSSARQAGVYDRSHFEALFASGSDPWRYTSEYEQIKYKQTLSLLPDRRVGRALELACAEGHFTVELAGRVGQLLATDFSQIALERAASRCREANLENVQLSQLDLSHDPLPGPFDLIVCSEVLYYLEFSEALQEVCGKMVGALNPGGYLLAAHSNLVTDNPSETGFDWGLPFGAQSISDTLHKIPNLELRKELHTPLYRIQLYQRKPRLPRLFRRSQPEIIRLSDPPAIPLTRAAAQIRWKGKSSSILMPEHIEVFTHALPILMYHRVAPTGSSTLARYRVAPDMFEQQLQYLHSSGYYSISLEDWQAAMAIHQPLPGRAVILTFDDGYQDFRTHAWPLLNQYGFSATVFLASEYIGRTNLWDRPAGEDTPLLDWEEIRLLQAEGVEFGSHTANHHRLTGLTPTKVTHELLQSRLDLEQELGSPVRAIAYPYGATDGVIQHLAGACGYRFGLTCVQGRSGLWDQLLTLRRIEISGTDSFSDFVLKLSPGS